MNSDTKPMFVHGIESINSNSTIPDLISFTRSAFRPSDFDLVQRILIDREANMKKEYELMEKKHDLKEKKHAEAALVYLEMEVEFEKYKQKVESLRKVEREKNELIFQLNEEIKELKYSKGRADLLVEALKKKLEELEQRVGRLEEDVTALGSEFPPKPEQNDLRETGIIKFYLILGQISITHFTIAFLFLFYMHMFSQSMDCSSDYEHLYFVL